MSKSQINHDAPPTKPIECLDDDQLELFLSYPVTPEIELMLLLLSDTGVRVRELVGLIWSDLWFADEPVGAIEIRAEIAKNKKSRQIPVSKRLSESITTTIKRISTLDEKWLNGPVIRNTNTGKAYTTRQVERIILDIGSRAIRRRVTPHMLRHTFATRLMKKCSTRIVQILLGHSSLQSTQIYTHPNSVDLQNAVNLINESHETGGK